MPMACRGVVTVSKNVSDTSAKSMISATGADTTPNLESYPHPVRIQTS